MPWRLKTSKASSVPRTLEVVAHFLKLGPVQVDSLLNIRTASRHPTALPLRQPPPHLLLVDRVVLAGNPLAENISCRAREADAVNALPSLRSLWDWLSFILSVLRTHSPSQNKRLIFSPLASNGGSVDFLPRTRELRACATVRLTRPFSNGCTFESFKALGSSPSWPVRASNAANADSTESSETRISCGNENFAITWGLVCKESANQWPAGREVVRRVVSPEQLPHDVLIWSECLPKA